MDKAQLLLNEGCYSKYLEHASALKTLFINISDEHSYFPFLCNGNMHYMLYPAIAKRGDASQNLEKSNIQKGGPNPHRKFQHSSSIRECLKIGETQM